LRDLERDRQVLPHPSRLLTDLRHRLDEELPLPVLDDLPGPAVEEEDLRGRGQYLRQDEPFVEGREERARGRRPSIRDNRRQINAKGD
jgi:hypothetical protein